MDTPVVINRLNYTKSLKDFSAELDKLIAEHTAKQITISLPFGVDSTSSFLGVAITSSINSMLDCSKCDARCCKAGRGDYIYLAPADSLRLLQIDQQTPIIVSVDQEALHYPCHFLKDNKCTVYNDRPQSCCVYPVQAMDKYFSMQTDCPQTPIIIRKIYISLWHTIHSIIDHKTDARR